MRLVSHRHTRCLSLGWNSLERLSKDNADDHENIYVQHGFMNLLKQVFVNRIDEARLRLSTVVQRICIYEEEQYVRVEVNDGQQQPIVYRAQHVVCTQSLGCLKQSMHQLFVPALPHAKRMCIQRLAFGTTNRVSVRQG